MNTNTNTPASRYDAVIACPHEIADKRIALRFDPKQPGHNALNQLSRRMADAIAPATPQGGHAKDLAFDLWQAAIDCDYETFQQRVSTALLAQAIGPVASTEATDGAWHWVIYETLAGERNWVPAQRKSNHWNSTNFSGIPLCEVTVGPVITLAAPVQDLAPTKTSAHHAAVRKVLVHHGLTEHGDGVVEADLIYAVLNTSTVSMNVAPSDAIEGWQLVPTTSTEEMHAAAVRTIQRCNGNADFPPRVYRAMLAAAPAAPQAVPNAPYSLDADPAGVRALAADAITGALAFGAQGNNPAPAGHWLAPFWQMGRDTAQAADPDTKGMLAAACADLGRIAERLGVDPDDAGADPILAAIDELTAAQPAAVLTAELHLLEEVCSLYANDEDRYLRGDGEAYGGIPTSAGLKARAARQRFMKREQEGTAS